jgi:hypothetical protein
MEHVHAQSRVRWFLTTSYVHAQAGVRRPMLSSFHLQKASAGFVPFAAPPLPFAVQEQPKENMRIAFKHTQTVID